MPNHRKPWADAESPRTVEMWKNYDEKARFPISPGDEELMSKLRDVYIYTRKAIECSSPRDVQGNHCGAP